MGFYVVAVQPNGEHLRYERWVYDCWLEGNLNDTLLTRGLRNAIGIYRV